MIKYFFIFISLAMVSCNTKPDKEYTYFGGKIVNPKGEYVILYNNGDEVIDSLHLNKDNTFSSKLQDLKSGLYCFKHGTEYQYVFLEPKDSLLIRLNTWDFDESLVFSGKNAIRNNVLIEAFLENELQNKQFYKYYNLNAKDFKNKVDSLKRTKDEYIKNYTTKNNEESEVFLNVLKIALNYPLYTKLESFVIDNSLKQTPEDLNINAFTKHRETASIDSDSLMFYTPYRNYVYSNLYSDVYQKKIKDDSDDFTIALLNVINTKIKSPKLRNKLLKETTIRHFYKKSSCGINKKAYETYVSLSTDPADKKEISSLLNDVKHISKNHEIPDFNLSSHDGAIEKITDVIKDKNAVIYFRNKQYSSDNWVASRMNYLINNHPNIKFLVVNIDADKYKHVKDLNIEHQYYLHEKSNAHQFLTSKYPRMILVNDKGIVINGFCALSSKKIEKQISDL